MTRHRPDDGCLSQASGARRPCSPPSKAVISRLLFSLRHFKLTGGCDVPFQFQEAERRAGARSGRGRRWPCPSLRPKRSPFGLAGRRARPTRKTKTRTTTKDERGQGDTSNEIRKGTFLKSFDTRFAPALTS